MPQLRRDVSTAIKARPSAPQISLKSPFAGEAHTGDLIVEGDPYFVKHGCIIIERGAIELYRFIADGERLNPPQIKIQLANTLWNKNDRINVWVWSRTGDIVKMEIFLTVDLRPVAPTSAVLPPNRAELLQFAPDQNPLKNTAQTFIERLRDRLDDIADPSIRAELRRWTIEGFNVADREAMLPRLDTVEYEIYQELAALEETLPIPDYTGNAIFPLKTYTAEDHARLIHMRGARNAALLLYLEPHARPAEVERTRRGQALNTPIYVAGIPPGDGIQSFSSSGLASFWQDLIVWRVNPDISPRQVSVAASLSTAMSSTGGYSVRDPGSTRFNPDGDYNNYPLTWVGSRRELILEGASVPGGPWSPVDRYGDAAMTTAAATSTTFSVGATAFIYFRLGAQTTEFFRAGPLQGPTRLARYDGGTISFTTKQLSMSLNQNFVRPGYPPSIRFELKGPDGDWNDLSGYTQFPGDPADQDPPAEGQTHFYGQDLGNSVLPTGPSTLRLYLKATPPPLGVSSVYTFPPRSRVRASIQLLA